jgi:hypothetical protein
LMEQLLPIAKPSDRGISQHVHMTRRVTADG